MSQGNVFKLVISSDYHKTFPDGTELHGNNNKKQPYL